MHRKIKDRYFLYNACVVEISFSELTSLSHVWYVAGLACNFVCFTFFIIRFQVLCCGCYKLLQSCCGFECYSYLGISKQVGDFLYLRTMISKCGPGPFVDFISIVCVISFIVYLSVEFLKVVLWKVVVPCNGLYCLPLFLFFCLDPVVGTACGLCENLWQTHRFNILDCDNM